MSDSTSDGTNSGRGGGEHEGWVDERPGARRDGWTPDPEPDAPGLLPGGGVDPGDTPPGEGSVWGGERPEAPRGTVISPVALIVIAVLVLLVLGFVLGKAASLY